MSLLFMPALTLIQPWATLVAIGAKRVETRSWPTGHHPRLAIHAAKRWTREDRELCEAWPFRESLAEAGISSYHDRFAWFLEDIEQLEPIPCRGLLGLWAPPVDVLVQIKAQLKATA